MRRLLAGAILALTLVVMAAPVVARQIVTLKPDATVDDAQVRLGDLFDGVPRETDNVVVSRSPAPGERLAYRVSALRALAWRHGLDWQPAGRKSRVYVRRTSRIVPTSEIRGLLTLKIAAIAGRDVSVEIGGRNFALYVGIAEEPSVAVDSVNYDQGSGRFEAVLRAPADDLDARPVRVRGRAFPLTEIPVLIRRLGPNQVISPADIELMQIRAERVPRRIAREIDEIVGLSPKRSLPGGRPIRLSDLTKPVLIAKGSLVTMIFRARAMTLTATGRALEDASRGEVVRVLNTRSRATVEGVAVAAGEVHIGSSRMATIASR